MNIIKNISRIALGLLLCSTPFVAEAQNIIPIPLNMEAKPGESLLWTNLGSISAPASLQNEIDYAKEMLKNRAGINIDSPEAGASAVMTLSIDESLSDPEAYTLDITSSGVNIKGKTATGVFRGLTTLEQIMNGDGTEVTCTESEGISISDEPRIHIREFMVDPARHFIPFEDLKAFIPEMARYKMNSLHVHLTDDQAWRIEIKKYPLLTEKGSYRVGMDDMQKPISGFYTQEQMRELVAFAAKYHVDVVPEVEMPGHSVAAIHCYPYLTCGGKDVAIRTTCGVSNELLCASEERMYEFYGNVFREMCDIFPSKYFHIGGDEAGNPALGCWSNCTQCNAKKTELGYTANWQLQEYMFNRMIDTLQAFGKTPQFWYETDFKKIREGCVTFGWRHGLTQAAINACIANNAKIMLCPGEYCYLDYPNNSGDMPEVNWGMPTISLEKTYSIDPSWGNDESFEKNNLYGIAGTLWSECINSPERIYYQAYPRGLAIAEAGWSAQKNRSWESFINRLPAITKDMQRRGITSRLPNDNTDMQ